MDLIQNYTDQESQGSSSIDAAPPEQDRKDFQLPANQPLKATENDCKPRPVENFGQWLNEVDKRLHFCLGSMKPLQKNAILESMDYFINKLNNDYDYLIKPKIADILANYIRTYLCVYKHLYRSYDMVSPVRPFAAVANLNRLPSLGQAVHQASREDSIILHGL